MPKVKTYTVKATVINGVVSVDHESKEENPEVPPVNFDENSIVKYAQEVSEFNNVETSSIEKMGDGKYTIDFKLIL
jgi:hypothetical protein